MDKKQAIIEKINHQIKKNGFTIIQTMTDDPNYSVTFAYTVGLWKNRNHPEIVMSGFNLPMMAQLLNIAGQRIMNSKEQFLDGMKADRIIQDYPVKMILPPNNVTMENPFNVATYFYDGYGFEVVQMQLPDEKGLFPGDDGCSPEMTEMQSRLFRSAIEKAGKVKFN